MTEVYVAGIMTSKPSYNFQEFDSVARGIWLEADRSGLQVRVFSPSHISMQLGTGLDYNDYMREDIKVLSDCDVLIMLEGWRESKGASIEYALAVGLGIKIVEFDYRYIKADLVINYERLVKDIIGVSDGKDSNS